MHVIASKGTHDAYFNLSSMKVFNWLKTHTWKISWLRIRPLLKWLTKSDQTCLKYMFLCLGRPNGDLLDNLSVKVKG